MRYESRSLWSYIKQDSRWLTLSNVFSVIRIALAPVVALGLYYQYWVFTFIIFVIAALTDVFDGYFARLWQEQTNLGRVLDPLADKLFLITTFIALLLTKFSSFTIPLWFVFLFVVREGIMIVGSFFVVYACPNVTIKPNFLGKVATFFHMVFIAWLLCCSLGWWRLSESFFIWMIVLLVFSFVSLIQYVWQFLRLLLNYLFEKLG